MKLTLQDVQVRYGSVKALNGVDLDLIDGTVQVLAGPNGAGKSTLIGVLLGLVRPVGGTLKIGDHRQDLARRRVPFELRHQIGYLPEAVAFAEALTGRQILRFHGRARGVSRQTTDRVLERVGLAHAARRAVRGYSRGMRQRLGLAIAIVAEPQLLVLDEPTVGLDQEGLGLLWEVLAHWRSEGRTVVVSTHDLALIERRADHVQVLRAGRCVASGSPAALREQADLPVRVRMRLSSAEALGSLTRRLSDTFGAERVGHTEDAVEVRSTGTEVAAIIGLVNGELEEIVSTRVIEPGLDEVYERLLERGGQA